MAQVPISCPRSAAIPPINTRHPGIRTQPADVPMATAIVLPADYGNPVN